ncbi:hypothetical protein [Cellulosimicrobium sp. NPDC057127]|uniref:hypothetical protein n=1 Tax=Cellulosimicrobium sp. NPDC057127 TaxID=3346026 RepID=UPI00362AE9EB
MPSTRPAAVAVAAVLALTVSGCSLVRGADETAPSSGAPAAEESTAAVDGVGTARVADGVMAEQTVDAPGEGDAGTLTVTIRELAVQGGTMTLRWALRWDDDGAAGDASISYYDMGVEPVVTVTDPANLVAYRPLCTEGAWQPDTESVAERGSAQSRCQATMLVSPLENVFFDFPNHGTVEAYAVLPAPEERVETLDVLPAEGLPAFTAVEVTYLDDAA